MSKLKDFVEIQITRETAKLTQVGFGTATFFGPHYHIPITEKVRSYTDAADMLDDGFLVTDALYILALKHMSQEYSPAQFKIARKAEDVNSKATLAFTGTPSAGTWTLDIGIGAATPVTTGAITYAADDDTAVIEAAIEALTGITEVTVTGLYSTGYTIEFTGVDAAADFRITAIDVSTLTGVTAATVTMTQYGSAVETWAAGLAAVIAYDNDWYALVTTIDTIADVLAMSAIIEAEYPAKTYFVNSDDADIKNGVAANLLKQLKALNYDRTSLFYSEDTSFGLAAAILGKQLPKDPGSTSWKYQELIGITPDVLTATQINNIKNDNGNIFEEVAGLNVTTGEGVMVGGEYIYVIRGTDYIEQRMAEGIFTALINNDKISMTIPDLNIIGAVVEYWLQQGVVNKLFVDGSITVTIPKPEDITPADRAAGYLNYISFTATYAIAVNKVKVVGKIGV